MNRRQRAGRQHRPLHALLSALLDERVEVGEIAELRFVDGRLRADGQRLSDLRNHHADLPGGHLHPGMFRHREHQRELEAEAGHQHFRLVPRLPTERERVVSGQFGAESFSDQSDLGGTDAVDRGQQNVETGCRNNRDDEIPECKVECHGKVTPRGGVASREAYHRVGQAHWTF